MKSKYENNKYGDNSELKRAEGSLFSNNVISEHLIEHLIKLGHPETSISSMKRCGFSSGFMVVSECSNCGFRNFELKYHCCLRTCPDCSKLRKRRLRLKYLPYLKDFLIDRNRNQLYFLTISPLNYGDFKEGLENIKKSFKKFIRTKYIKERIKAGLFVIETTNTGKKWNIHIHCILYGRRLDNQIRGKCLDCGQNLLKFDYNNKRYYCSNRKCNSLNVKHKQDSKIVQIFKKCSKRDVNIHISRQSSKEHTLNYMLKYISANKYDFSSEEDFAKYIYYTRKQRLVSTFGLFFKFKAKKPQCHCFKCGSPIQYLVDWEISELLKENIKKENVKKPPNLLDF